MRILLALSVAVVLAIGMTSDASARHSNRQVILSVFGSGSLGRTMVCIARRESHLHAWAFNGRDHHSDGSWGSTGLFQIGTLWRNRGESPAHFIRRMKNPWANARAARALYEMRGLEPWGGGC